jgi:hypothetical protein
MNRALRLARGLTVLAVSMLFLGSVFQFSQDGFWRNGLGDWMDPYFINYLLEHWYHAVRTLSSPASPPMYFPSPRTLGYSHGLVLFAPFYVLVRPFLHPFQAYSVALCLLIETGILSLYVLLRRAFALSFVESLLLTVFFFTSLNVVNGFMGVWSQRASVFLIPPILLVLFTAIRLEAGWLQTALAALAGFLSTLMLTQDFYSAFFAAVFVVAAVVPVLLVKARPALNALRLFWRGEARGTRLALVSALSLTLWGLFIVASGGFGIRVAGIRIASHDWRRPVILAALALAAVILLRQRAGRMWIPTARGWRMPFILGAGAGVVIFAAAYLAAYAEHRTFPEQHLMNALVHVDTSRWTSPLDLFRHLDGYETLRTFKLIFVIGVLASLPAAQVNDRTKLLILWALCVSALVLVIPISFNGFSIWKSVLAPLPGFSVIRDPKRIAYLYELAAILGAGAFISRLPRRSWLRVASTLLLVLLIATERNHTVFDFDRPNATFDRWVASPVAVDGSCRSFFVTAAGSDYTQRSADKWTLYGIDAAFIALETSVPTLNGYSAWFPDGWAFQNPEEPGYEDAVGRWISRNRLTGVCSLDLVKRTMTPAGAMPSF